MRVQISDTSSIHVKGENCGASLDELFHWATLSVQIAQTHVRATPCGRPVVGSVGFYARRRDGTQAVRRPGANESEVCSSPPCCLDRGHCARDRVVFHVACMWWSSVFAFERIAIICMFGLRGSYAKAPPGSFPSSSVFLGKSGYYGTDCFDSTDKPAAFRYAL